MVMCDSRGAIFEGRSYGMNPTKDVVAKWTNKDKIEGSLRRSRKRRRCIYWSFCS